MSVCSGCFCCPEALSPVISSVVVKRMKKSLSVAGEYLTYTKSLINQIIINSKGALIFKQL